MVKTNSDVTIGLGGSSKQWHMGNTEDQLGSGIEGLAVPLDFRQKWPTVIVLLIRVKGANSDIRLA